MKFTAEHFKTTKYGKLRMKNPEAFGSGSHKRPEWVCDCGRTASKEVCSVVRGHTTTCGSCNELPASYWERKKFGKLLLKVPKDMFPSSHELVLWVCDCGKEVEIAPLYVTHGHNTTCGSCHFLPKEYFQKTKFGKLVMENPEGFSANSHESVSWKCDCGRSSNAAIGLVTTGKKTSCGRCTELSSGYWETAMFGRLRMKDPAVLKPGSNRKVAWICSCGQETRVEVYTVTAGNVKSCGRCSVKVSEWFSVNGSVIRGLKCPFPPESFPIGLLKPLETVRGHDIPFRAECGLCSLEYRPRFGNIRKGSSLTCGCRSNHVSEAQVQIRDFIRSLGHEAVLEHKAYGWQYDIWVPGPNLLIEYDGLRWHAVSEARRKAVAKYKAAVSAGHSYLMMFEDEWSKDSRQKMEALIRNKLSSPLEIRSLRPSQCELTVVDSDMADEFYNSNHYIGRCNASAHLGALFGKKLIACQSFARPTRQSSHPWELVRMASDPFFRIHGIWSKLLRKFASERSPSSIVSFSDNRLFSGGVYEKIGFKFDGDVPPDYYWVKGGKRFHKSGLRKPKGCLVTETELRESEGYKKVWDLGKKRWVWRPPAV